jgi:hypothetical protein
VIAQRIFAVLAALMLVGAVALAMLGPPSVPLGQMMLMIDHDLMEAARRFTSSYVSTWLWDHVMVPLMLRPAWMVPAALGLVCIGLALSLSTRKPAERSHRRS